MGSAYDKGSLIAIQNGIRPYRVVRLRLDELPQRHSHPLEVLESNHTLFDEPTTGAVVRDRYYFIGNSHWPAFADGKTPDTEALGPSPDGAAAALSRTSARAVKPRLLP